jgi:hypothetical protein
MDDYREPKKGMDDSLRDDGRQLTMAGRALDETLRKGGDLFIPSLKITIRSKDYCNGD